MTVSEAALGTTREDPDAGRRARVAQGPGGQPGRAHAARARQGRPRPQGRAGRPARAPARARAREAHQGAEAAVREARRHVRRIRARRRWAEAGGPDAAIRRQRRQAAVHDLGRGRARRHAPADAAHVRAPRPAAPAADGQEHAPLLAAATSTGCSASRSSPSSVSTSPAWSACWPWSSSSTPWPSEMQRLQAELMEAAAEMRREVDRVERSHRFELVPGEPHADRAARPPAPAGLTLRVPPAPAQDRRHITRHRHRQGTTWT